MVRRTVRQQLDSAMQDRQDRPKLLTWNASVDRLNDDGSPRAVTRQPSSQLACSDAACSVVMTLMSKAEEQEGGWGAHSASVSARPVTGLRHVPATACPDAAAGTRRSLARLEAAPEGRAKLPLAEVALGSPADRLPSALMSKYAWQPSR